MKDKHNVSMEIITEAIAEALDLIDVDKLSEWDGNNYIEMKHFFKSLDRRIKFRKKTSGFYIWSLEDECSFIDYVDEVCEFIKNGVSPTLKTKEI